MKHGYLTSGFVLQNSVVLWKFCCSRNLLYSLAWEFFFYANLLHAVIFAARNFSAPISTVRRKIYRQRFDCAAILLCAEAPNICRGKSCRFANLLKIVIGISTVKNFAVYQTVACPCAAKCEVRIVCGVLIDNFSKKEIFLKFRKFR